MVVEMCKVDCILDERDPSQHYSITGCDRFGGGIGVRHISF